MKALLFGGQVAWKLNVMLLLVGEKKFNGWCKSMNKPMIYLFIYSFLILASCMRMDQV